MSKRRALGKGIRALIPEKEDQDGGVVEIAVDDIRPNPYQPRHSHSEEGLRELAASIKEHGVIQPLVVSRDEEGFMLIVGERRWRAARAAGVGKVPALVRDVSQEEMMVLALIENLQREDLNPIEEAMAYKRLMSEFGLTQSEVADVVGKGRATVANRLRLLNLEEGVKEEVAAGNLSAGHAKALASVSDAEEQVAVAREAVEEGLTVREVEKLVRERGQGDVPRGTSGKEKRRNTRRDPVLSDIEGKLQDALGTKVRIKNKGEKGIIQIDYYSNRDMERIIELIVGKE